jgi:hypothetical protein
LADKPVKLGLLGFKLKYFLMIELFEDLWRDCCMSSPASFGNREEEAFGYQVSNRSVARGFVHV